ncbi:peroxiredoxin [Candidatus Pseudothioglobus singularis]|nr:peroxiredoxin [Candidatus Pseudothioglobus singularis]MDB4598667.1 peroxiredoxin [Candidatus Pseudothioglobus singularis]MDC1064953.1 peroxiredoxin [Candidatus Pseudothioglobus singularis]
MTRLFKQFIIVAVLLPFSFASLAQIKVGSKAPNFTLSDQNSIQHQLSDYEGSWVILYFYPKDDTPGCTTQACDFRDAVKRIIASKSNVFGVSLDSVESHKRFADKNNLPFSLLSDESGEVSEAYDSLNNFMSFKSAKRNTFIIDPDGKVAKIYLSVKPSTHSQMVLNDLNQLQN